MNQLLRLVLACLMLGSGSSGGEEKPVSQVVSINLCTDQLLLQLADPDQIASVSHLARDPQSSFVADQASDYPINHARLEELIVLRPDLVLAGAHSDPRLLAQLQRFNIPVAQFSLTSTLSGIEADIQRMAELLGRRQQGERLIERMRAELKRIVVSADPSTKPGALFYQPRGYTSGRHTLQDTALKAAGWRNLAAEQGITGYAPMDLETLLLAEPQQLFTSGHSTHAPSRAQQQLQHPALRQILHNRPLVDIPFKYWLCAGPMITDAITALAAAHGRASATGAGRPGVAAAHGKDCSCNPFAFTPSLEVRRASVTCRDAQMPREAGCRKRPAGSGRDCSHNPSAFPPSPGVRRPESDRLP